MKRVITVLAVLAFSLSMMAQDTSKPSDQHSQSNQASQSNPSNPASPNSTSTGSSSGQGQRMTGKVSKNAKTFTDDKSGKSYTVNNPDSLQNYENQHVIVLVQTDPDTGNVTITAVQPPQ